MSVLYRLGIAHPVRVILVAVAMMAAVAPGLAGLRLRTDGHALVPEAAAAVQYDESVRAEFGIDDLIVLLVRTSHRDGIYNLETLRLVRDLTDEVAGIEGVDPDNVTSLATEKGDRHRPGTLDYWPLLEPFPETPEALALLRDDLAALEVHVGSLVSDDGTAAAIHVGVRSGADRVDLYGRFRRATDAARTAQDSVSVIGAPVAESLLGSQILDDLGVPRFVLRDAARAFDAAGPAPSALTPYGFRRWIGGTIGLLPVAVAIMALVFLIAFRSLSAAAIPLVEVGACLLITFALMGWTGSPVYLTTAVLPVILTSIGVADEVHILSRYRQRLRALGDGDHVECVERTMAEIAAPVVRTSITTAAAFLAFALSPITAVRSFGVFAAVGIIICMTWSLAVTPALLVLLGPERFVPRASRIAAPAANRVTDALARMAGAAARYRVAVLALAAVVLVAAPLGVRRLQVQDSWVGGFDPASEFRTATEWFNRHFHGAHVLLVCVGADIERHQAEVPEGDVEDHDLLLPPDFADDPAMLVGGRLRVTRPEGDEPAPDPEFPRMPFWEASIETARREEGGIRVTWARQKGSPRIGIRLAPDDRAVCAITIRPMHLPRVMRAIAGLESFLEAQADCAVGGVLGPADYLTTTNFIVRKRDPDARIVPDTPDRIRWLWEQYERIRGPVRTRQIVDAELSRGIVTVFLEDANFRDTDRLMRHVRAHEREHLAPLGLSLSFAGDVAVSQTLISAIVATQVRSLLLSLLVILILATILNRSVRFGLLSVLPCAIAVLLNFAVMGWAGIPLGVATSMFAGMILGIGVDYAIHLLDRFRHAQADGAGTGAAIRDAARVAGPAIAVDAVVVALGFGVLTLSQVPANARLGLLVMLCIAVCFVSTMLVLPALLGRRGEARAACLPPES